VNAELATARRPECPVPLADQGSHRSTVRPAHAERVGRLLAGAPAVSLHDHPIRLPDPLTQDSWPRYRDWGRDELGAAGLRASGLSAVFANTLSRDTAERVRTWSADLNTQVDAATGLHRGHTAADIRTGELAVFLALETVEPFGSPDGVAEARELGFRCAGLTHNQANHLGGGCSTPEDPGLSREGHAVVAALVDAGIAVDLAHAGDRTSLEAIEAAGAPVLITHAGARSVWDSTRMKPDHVLLACARAGGLIGISAAPGTTRSPRVPGHTVDSVVDHLRHVVDLVGVAHVGIGPDTWFGPHHQLHRVLGYGRSDTERVEFTDGMENPAEAFALLADRLVEAGFADGELRALLGGNAIRVLSQVLR
jgi:membrane dipeptidase